MTNLAGIGKQGRRRLTTILEESKGTFTVKEASGILRLPANETAKALARWVNQGWLVRLRRGLYTPVALDSTMPMAAIDDPWIIAQRLFSPCYIGGWSAAEHWGLTEQIFRTVIVFTNRPIRNRREEVQGIQFWAKKVAASKLYGTRTVWRGQNKIQVSDSSKTVVDMLDDPAIGGGIRIVEDILKEYLRSATPSNLAELLAYAERAGNGAIFKRLGFLFERIQPDNQKFLQNCRKHLTSGNAKLDPSWPAEKLVTRWHLWIPESWVTRMEK
ncbi:type IV toxin-antitoxin system AbiEi family antitoxin domain-containing protein [candidate division KSB1 bacterium]|nr:type IV toxin-antitoxin system AbiEi family antitoxin domain-containing protein [candidate division KSB1 bacterium]